MLPFVPAGGVTCSAPPGKDEKNFMHQKNDDCHNHRLCVLYLFGSEAESKGMRIGSYHYAANSSFRGL